jgi:hypothetical protein
MIGTRRRTRVVELRRRISIAREALRLVDDYLARELDDDASCSIDEARRIEDATRAAASAKDH